MSQHSLQAQLKTLSRAKSQQINAKAASSLTQFELAYLRMASAQGIASKHWLELLLRTTLSPHELLTAENDLHAADIDKLKMQTSDKLTSLAIAWEKECTNHHIVSYDSSNYPCSLKQLDSPPLVLFVVGEPQCLIKPQVAVVGSRRASVQGKQIAKTLASDLSNNGITVTSGLAMGIDSAAHHGGLVNPGKTVAVMGTGPDIVYPAKNKSLFDAIVSGKGACITEFFPGQGPKPWHFPRRNRIIAALTLGTLVVEAKIKSGTLITANLAADLGREVFAVPGNIYHAYAQGCHWLIQQGAKLVTNVNDIIDEIDVEPLQLSIPVDIENEKSEVNSLATDKLLASVDYDITAIDVIAQRNAVTVSDVMASLLEYELRGLVAAVPGGYIKLRGK